MKTCRFKEMAVHVLPACGLFLVCAFAVGAKVVAQDSDLPHIVFIVGEHEYGSEETMPKLAKELQARFDVKVTLLTSDMGGVEYERVPDIEIPEFSPIEGLEVIREADLIVLFIRFRIPPKEQFDLLQEYFDAGKPAVAFRTTSHAFWHKKGWFPVFFGGHYKTHASNEEGTTSLVLPAAADHPIMRGVARSEFLGEGGVYNAQPLSDTATPLLLGKTDNFPSEPIAWVNKYKPESRIFYTSLGSRDNFEQEAFQNMTYNAIFWALGREIPPGGILKPDAPGAPAVREAAVPPRPPLVAPEGATVLFSGSDLSQWKHWDPSVDPKAIGIDRRADSTPGGPVFSDARWAIENGAAVAAPSFGDILTKEAFGNYRLHIDFLVPEEPAYVQGRFRGASGVYLSGKYEVAILDSYGEAVDATSSGSIYGVKAPSTNAAKKAGEWQSLDIEYRQREGEPARISVALNGTQVQDNTEVREKTLYGFRTDEGGEPLYLSTKEEGATLYNMGADFSIVARIKTEREGTLVRKTGTGPGGRRGSKYLRVDEGHVVYFAGRGQYLATKSEVADGKVHEIVLAIKDGAAKIYVDGNLEAEGEGFARPDGEGHVLRIGDVRRGFTQLNQDELEEIRFYSRAIVPREGNHGEPALVWKPEVNVIDPNAIIPDVKGPIRLQADSSKVRFANIWLKPLDD
jgi:type 1 glutamine amidotransferase